MESNNLRRDLLDISQLNPWATEVGGNRKQMFTMNTKMMRLGLKVFRCMQKKLMGCTMGDFNSAGGFLKDQRSVYFKYEKLHVFEAHLNMWLQSAILDPKEYFYKVPLNKRWHRVFVERKQDVFVSKDGWQISWQQNETSFGCWVMRDPLGYEIEDRETFWEFQREYGYEFFSYEKRYGRSGKTEMDIKFGPAHFPEGTVVEVFVGPGMKEPKQLTVDSIYVIGARNYLLSMKEVKAEGEMFAGEPEEYNLAHVRRVIKRGAGKVNLINDRGGLKLRTLDGFLAENVIQFNAFYDENPQYERPKLRKGEYLFGEYDILLHVILDVIGTHPDHYGKWINSDRIFDYMKSRGFGRVISQFSPLNDDWMHFWIFDVQKLVDFLRKYQRLVFTPLDEVEKIEVEIDEKNASELLYYHD
ncbi:hypothetical protein [Ralstonia phage RSF1]|uniref:Uncharacterized protein n=1 Tax=Ralstonia phage RSF1 TaxID=1689679 RepID=A0A0K2QQS5_9CAUD|nr:hypothetical protein AVU11_gp152 [Ralstonia phage RSF1]BAS04944.1 hypothetical protein [Ralstonia phage RSF1]